ncbi:hypothetical protein HQ571_04545 [Candidatus Kuenenbacteria bacterium]|nr:hypothetical protein [Candidatus Kuenenbacteria bacterium]
MTICDIIILMKSAPTIIVVIILMLLIGMIGFVIGLYVGKGNSFESKLKQEKAEVIQNLNKNIESIPGVSVLEQPEDYLIGSIKKIEKNVLTISSAPATVEDLLEGEEKIYEIKISSQTKIFYQEIGEDPVLTEDEPGQLVTEHLLTIQDLQVNEQVSIFINIKTKNQPLVEALEIKVNR